MFDHGVSEFGRDHGVLHEAVVTGRKVGAGRGFWNSLAENKKLFGKFVGVTEGLYHEPEPIKLSLLPMKSGMDLPLLGTSWTQAEEWGSKATDLTELSLVDIVLESAEQLIPPNHRFDSQQERIGHMQKHGHRLLDARAFLALLRHPELIPIGWWYELKRREERFPADSACRSIRFDGESFLDRRGAQLPKRVTFGLEPKGIPFLGEKIEWKPVVHEMHGRGAHHEISAVFKPREE